MNDKEKGYREIKIGEEEFVDFFDEKYGKWHRYRIERVHPQSKDSVILGGVELTSVGFVSTEEQEEEREKIRFSNLSDVPAEEIEILQKKLEEKLPEDIRRFLPMIEVWNTPKDVHTQEEIERFKADNPEFDPDGSEGEEYNGRIILYRRAFQWSVYQSVLVAIHEIGHFIAGDEEAADKWVVEELINPGISGVSFQRQIKE